MSNSLFKRVVTLLLVVLMSFSGMSFKAVRADSSSTWEKVDETDVSAALAAAAESGKLVAITMTLSDGTVYALPTAEVSKNPAAVIATKNDNTLEIGGLEPGYGWTITSVDDGYTITNNAGSYLYLTNANAGVVIGGTPSSGY
ncbi:MAG: hypothetical protein IKS69_05735, partial [Erysipelotrichaceae bacterium]|nr:hypothetical protein [Erysipelotrichaceae bacterium]